MLLHLFNLKQWCLVSHDKTVRFNLVAYVFIVFSYLFTAYLVFKHMSGLDLTSGNIPVALIVEAFNGNSALMLVEGLLVVNMVLLFAALALKQSQITRFFESMRKPNKTQTDSMPDDVINTTVSVEVDLPEQPQEVNSDSQPSNDLVNGSGEKNVIQSTSAVRQELKLTQQKLETALSAKSQFLANMSHELRTPMNGILGMTELLIDSGLSDKQGRFADSVRRSAESLLAIINDLLDYSTMETGRLFLENAAFNLREVVEDVCELHADLAHRKGLELICHIDHSMNDAVIGDSNRIRQLLNNLVGNAIKFTKSGEIVIRLKEVSRDESNVQILLDVVDTGVGITPEGQASIFESFTQADNSYSREFGGAGLGLYITHKLVEMMNGKITFRSRMNEGSHFIVALSLEATTSEKANANMQGTLRGSRVLIVDDNETNRTILYHQLKSWGVHPETVESGERALEALREAKHSSRPFHIAILDLHMPAMDGIELTKLIQADPLIHDTQRIMLTSAALDMSPTELRAIGVSQYVSKPARQSQLYNVLANLIQNTGFSIEHINPGDDASAYRSIDAHVLLAEDNLINQDVALNMLENFGCTVKVVSNGRAALDLLKDETFDIVLMDCQMPVMDGLVATRRLRDFGGEYSYIPVIALTANVMEGDKEKCLESGMNGYISKPVKQEELYRSVCHWLDKGIVEKNIAESKQEDMRDSSSVSAQLEPRRAASHDEPPGELLGTIALSLDQKSEEANIDEPKADENQDETPIDDEALDKIRKLQRPGKPDILAKVVNVYLDKSPSLILEVIAGLANNDSVQVKEAAHSLKSSSAYVGAQVISENCKLIEAASREDKTSEVSDLIAGLQVQYDEAATILSRLIERAA